MDTPSPAPADRAHDPAALARLRRRLDTPGHAAPWLHGEVARRMAERLALIRRQPATVIDWWSANGGSDALLAGQYPKARRLALDSRGQVLPPTPGRWWRRLVGEGRDATPPASPVGELLWANMMLHWVDDLELPGLLARWHASLAVDGFLMFSCFGPDTLQALQALYTAAGWGPAASPQRDMHDLGDALVHAGFADPVMDMEPLTLTWDSPDALLAELRTLGRNTAPRRHAGLRTPRWQAALRATLAERLRGPDGRLHLRFEIVYGHAFRPVPRAKVAAQTEISLDAMREMTRRRNPGGAA